MIIEDLTTDLSDGIVLINLVECILVTSLPKYNRRPKMRCVFVCWCVFCVLVLLLCVGCV